MSTNSHFNLIRHSRMSSWGPAWNWLWCNTGFISCSVAFLGGSVFSYCTTITMATRATLNLQQNRENHSRKKKENANLSVITEANLLSGAHYLQEESNCNTWLRREWFVQQFSLHYHLFILVLFSIIFILLHRPYVRERSQHIYY